MNNAMTASRTRRESTTTRPSRAGALTRGWIVLMFMLCLVPAPGALAQDRSVAVVRLNADGTLDRTFGTGGRVQFKFVAGDQAEARALDIQRDGRIVVAGSTSRPFVQDSVVVARLLPNGQLDRAFGQQGVQIVAFDSLASNGSALAVRALRNGRILVAGPAIKPAGNSVFGLARLMADGSRDPGFGQNGGVITEFTGGPVERVPSIPRSIGIQDDGRIVLAGDVQFRSESRDLHGFMAVARYSGNGVLDRKFGGDGKVTIGFGSRTAGANAVLIQEDGSIDVAGTASNADQGTADFVLARLSRSGKLDASFASKGRATVRFGSGIASLLTAAALLEDGRAVLAGANLREQPALFDFGVAVVNPDAVLDTAFSRDGRATAGFFSLEPGQAGAASAVAVQGNGRIVVAGGVSGESRPGSNVALLRFGVARFTQTGALDRSFGSGGRLTVEFSSAGNVPSDSAANAIAIQGDGKIVLAGFTGAEQTSGGGGKR